LRKTFNREGAVFRVFLSDLSHLLISGIVMPSVNGLDIGITIEDHALWWLTIHGYDLVSTSSSTACREQLTTMGRYEFSRFREVLFRVPLRVGNFDLADEVDRGLGLRVEALYDTSTYGHAG
jgi:hypothetical protein